ncbi:hypothetical protein A4S05_25180 [Nostoc sp. KVJ20]|nr:hypothetical protein A4S05_25180 [Nostoc sp. KVJ20]
MTCYCYIIFISGGTKFYVIGQYFAKIIAYKSLSRNAKKNHILAFSFKGRLESQTLYTADNTENNLAGNLGVNFRIYYLCQAIDKKKLIHQLTLVNWRSIVK